MRITCHGSTFTVQSEADLRSLLVWLAVRRGA
jgi:hypothetical protein